MAHYFRIKKGERKGEEIESTDYFRESERPYSEKKCGHWSFSSSVSMTGCELHGRGSTSGRYKYVTI